MKEERGREPIDKVVGNILSFYKDHIQNKELFQKNLTDFKTIFGTHERFKGFKSDDELKPFSLILLGLRIYYETQGKKFNEEAANYILASSESYDHISSIEDENLKNMICFSLGCVEAAVLSEDLKREEADQVIQVISDKSADFLD